MLDGEASALVVLGPVGLRRNRAVRQRGCRECGQRAVEAVLAANEVRYQRGRASSGRPLRPRAAGYNRPETLHLKLLGAGLSCACRTQRRLHGDIEISIVGLQQADRYISVVNTDTAPWSRPDLLCPVAGLGVVAVEERALVGSCDRRTRWAGVTTR